MEVPAVSQLCERIIQENTKCELGDIKGLSASKELGAGNVYDDLHQMAQEACSQEISTRTIAKMDALLSTVRERHFMEFGWLNGERVYVVNADASHRIAAAKYLASVLGEKRTMPCDMERHTLVGAEVRKLCDQFNMFIVADEGVCTEVIRHAKALCAKVAWRKMPIGPLSDYCAFFLPKNNLRSMAVANAMRQRKLCDLGSILSKQRLSGIDYEP